MDHRMHYLQKNKVPELIDNLISKLVDRMPQNAKQFLASELAAQADARYTAAENMPDLKLSRTLLAKALTVDLWCRSVDQKTTFGGSLEQCVADFLSEPDRSFGADGKAIDPQTLERPGSSPNCGLIAVDEDCYTTLGEVFDAVIQLRHGVGYRASASTNLLDANVAKLKGGFGFDERKVQRIVIRVKRNIGGMRFAPTISRAERRDVERIVMSSLQRLQAASLLGRYYSVATMPTLLERNPRNTSVLLPRKTSCPLFSVGRDWPDARGAYINNDQGLAVHVNCGAEHVEIVSIATNQNIRDAWDKAMECLLSMDEALREVGHAFALSPHGLGVFTAELDYIGSGCSVEAHLLGLPRIVHHANFPEIMRKLRLRTLANPAQAAMSPNATLSETQASAALPTATADHDPAAVIVANAESFTASPVESLQAVVDGVMKLCELEAKLERGAAPTDEA